MVGPAFEYLVRSGQFTRFGRPTLTALYPFPRPENGNLPARGTRPPASLFGAGVIRPLDGVIEGNLTIPTGTVVRDKLINGRVSMQGTARIENCRVRGTLNPTGIETIINTTACSAPTQPNVSFCTIDPATPNMWTTGIGPCNYWAERNDVSRVVDYFSGFASPATPSTPLNITAINNYGHDFYRQATGVTYQGDGMTHNDGFQFQFGHGATVWGNWISAYAAPDVGNPFTPAANNQINSAAIMVNNNSGGESTDLLIKRNWSDGGQFAINAGAATGNLIAEENVFDRGAQLHADGNTYALSVKNTQTLVYPDGTTRFGGNVYDNGVAVVRRAG